jgi:hypothetical protein
MNRLTRRAVEKKEVVKGVKKEEDNKNRSEQRTEQEHIHHRTEDISRSRRRGNGRETAEPNL